MANFLFYTITVLIWGSTWLGIKFQLGNVEPALSVAYRFALAALILFVWCLTRRLPMRFSRADHFYIAMQGVFLFAFNYLLFYLAELQITSGLAAVVFSTIVVMNLLNGRFFLGTPIEIKESVHFRAVPESIVNHFGNFRGQSISQVHQVAVHC